MGRICRRRGAVRLLRGLRKVNKLVRCTERTARSALKHADLAGTDCHRDARTINVVLSSSIRRGVQAGQAERVEEREICQVRWRADRLETPPRPDK